MTPPERDGVMQAATNGAGSWQSRLFEEKVNDDRLYRALDRFLPHKEALGKHLKDRLRKLFQLEYELLLYDITSTHFEGEWRWQRPSPQRLFAGPAAKSQLKRFEKELLTKDWQEIREGLEVKRCASPEGEKESHPLS